MAEFSFEPGAGNKLEGEAVKAEQLKDLIGKVGFEVEELDIVSDGDTVTISGTAKDDETREKIIIMAGNTFGVATVDDKMIVKAGGTSKTQMHTVVAGDTLGKIAKQYYENAMKYTVIFEANKPMLKNADNIFVGQVLRIPAL